MKKLLFFLPLLFLIVFPHSVALADDSTTSAVASPTATVQSDYTLPYPGILPDNPLYFLKALRDRIIIFFISDPVKKGSFYLLQSDKRLESSWYLLKKGKAKQDLALSTLSKSTNYFDLAVGQVQTAKQAGQDTSDLITRLQDSLSKHILVVGQMLHMVGLTNNRDLLDEQKRLEGLEKGVSSLGPKQ